MIVQLVCGLCGEVQKSEKRAKLTMHTCDQINAATIADTKRQGGTFRNFSVNEFRCGSESSTAAKNNGGDESAGMILRPKQNHRHVMEEPRCTRVIKLTLQPSLTPHGRDEPSGTLVSTNSAVEANLQRPPKISEE